EARCLRGVGGGERPREQELPLAVGEARALRHARRRERRHLAQRRTRAFFYAHRLARPSPHVDGTPRVATEEVRPSALLAGLLRPLDHDSIAALLRGQRAVHVGHRRADAAEPLVPRWARALGRIAPRELHRERASVVQRLHPESIHRWREPAWLVDNLPNEWNPEPLGVGPRG